MKHLTDEQFEEALNTLNRKDLGGIELKDVPFVEELTDEAKIEFLKFCNFVYSSPYWKVIVQEHLKAQKHFTTMEAQGVAQGIFGRATCNSFGLIDEFFRTHSTQHKEAPTSPLSQEEKNDILPKS